MAVELPTLASVSTDDVLTSRAYLTQRLQEYAPNVDLKRGPLHDLLLHLSAVLDTALFTEIDRLRQSMSLRLVAQDPTLASDDTVDDILSNFLVERQPGAKSVGTITVQVSAFAPLVIPSTMTFSATGVVFQADRSYSVRTSQAQVVTTSDRLLRTVGAGVYAFDIDVTAVESGVTGNVKRGTRLAADAFIAGFVSAYSESDFTGGLTAETTAALLERIREGVSGRNLSNRTTINALVRSTDPFRAVQAMSVAGYGDPEQIRYHGLLPVANVGRIDVYLRSQGLPVQTRLVKSATLVRYESGGGGVWQFGIGRDEAPGFYQIAAIVPNGGDESSTGYEVVSDVRQADLTAAAGEFIPDIVTAQEAAYTRFQAVVIQFLDTTTLPDAVVGTKAEYVVFPLSMPLVKELQTHLAGRSVRHDAADILVRAAVPCFLRLFLTIRLRPGVESPDLDAIRTGLADYVNETGFVGRMNASDLTAEVYKFLGEGQSVSAIEIFGKLRRPDGTLKYIRSSDAVIVPDEPRSYVSARTVIFVLDPEDVGVSTQTVDLPEV